MKWYDIRDSRSKWRAFNFVVGGRGIGKTYSTASFMALGEGRGKFLYVRNYETQIDTACTDIGNPFRKISEDSGHIIYMKKKKNFALIYDNYFEDKEQIGAAVHASRYISLKGMDLSWVDYIFFDEFIEDRALQFDQGEAIKSIQETCNRNRELQGKPPVYMFMMSNSERLNNPALRTFGLIPVIEGMIKSGQTEWNSPTVHLELPRSEISELKRDTALYKSLDDNDSYKKMALENDFANESFYGIGKKNLNEYVPFLNIDYLYIYRHKSNGTYYVCTRPASHIKKLTTKDNLMLFKAQYSVIFKVLIVKDAISYESFTVKSQFENILSIPAM